MWRAMMALGAAMLVGVLWTTTAWAADCAYRPDTAIPSDADTSLTYANVGQSGFKYRAALLNDLHHYTDIPDACPPGFDGQCIVRQNTLTLSQQRVHQPPAAEAVVLIHGNSAQPDDWFEGGRGYYTNGAGLDLYDRGFDIYAPYITHNSRFQNARRRLASLKGEGFNDLDVQRVANLIDDLTPRYQRLHVAGASQGGLLSVLVFQELRLRHPAAATKLGAVLAIEGYLPASQVALRDPSNALFAWNWEMLFPGPSDAEYLSVVNDPHVYVAYGSCGAAIWRPIAGVEPASVMTYDGPHEFRAELLVEAIGRYRQVAGLPSCTPRPPVRVTTREDRPGLLVVTLASQTPIVRVEVGSPHNADVSPATITGTTATLTVAQRSPGAYQAPFVVVDACGPWPSFAGAGG